MMDKFSNINERISLLVDNQSDGNQKKFAESIGFAPQVVYNIVSGRKSKPSFDVLNAIITSFVDVSPEWLLTGKGSMLREQATEVPAPSKAELPQADINAIIELSTRLGEQTNENKHLHKKNMTLLSELEILKKENEKLKTELKDIKSRTKQLTNVAAAQYVEKKVTHSFVAEPEQEKLKK